MLAIEKITEQVRDLVLSAVPEFADRVHLNRSKSYNYERSLLPASNVIQGGETPASNLTDYDFTGWIGNVSIHFTAAGEDDHEIIKELNSFRLRITNAILAQPRLNLDFVTEMAPADVGAPTTISDIDSSVIVKELQTAWQIAYRVPRQNYNVST